MNNLSQNELDELASLEEKLWRSETRFNKTYMREVMSPDFFEFGQSGHVYDLEEVLSADSKDIEAELPLPNLKIRQLSDDVFQVTYDSAVVRGKKVQAAHRSSIWSRSEGKWELRFHQGTPYTSGS
ncbi:MAG: DUF4440 domain-containing protein [Pseudohongiellaceae bacterium]